MADNVSKNTMLEAVYDALKQAIMTLHYPPGTVMSTQEIATKLNVSRTPVREAFLRLQQEGLVDMIPQRETMVSRIDLKRVEEERFIRESLEVAVIDPFLQRCKPSHFTRLREVIQKQRELLQEKRYADFVNYDNQWHRLVFDVAERPLAWETMMSVNGHYNRIRVLTARIDATSAGVIQQHYKIMALMEEGKADDARAEIMDHVGKLNVEKTDLIRLYPHYFTTAANPTVLQIGKL